MNKNWISAVICTALASFVLTTNTQADVVFSNDFEDGDMTAEIGTMTLVTDTAVPSVVPVTGGSDPTLGNNVALLDLNPTTPTMLDLTLDLTNTLSLADGNTVSLDFDVAARRTNGIAKTIHVDAVDSNGNIVMRFVLGDTGSFGNSNSDRQRPGYATLADGRLVFGTPPGSFWWGADGTPDEFDPIRDAHVTLTIGASSFDITTTKANGLEFTATAVSNYDTVTSADIAEIRITSPLTVFGMYFDNLKVEGVLAEVSDALKGDVDLSGVVDFGDIGPFIGVLQSGGFQDEADVNCSTEVTFGDIGPFIAILQAG